MRRHSAIIRAQPRRAVFGFLKCSVVTFSPRGHLCSRFNVPSAFNHAEHNLHPAHLSRSGPHPSFPSSLLPLSVLPLPTRV